MPINKQSKQPFTVLKVDLNQIKDTQKPVILEIISKKAATKARAKSSTSYKSTYKETKEDKVINVMDSPVAKVVGVLLNPTTLLLALYFSSVGWSQVLWLQKILNVFGKGSLNKKADGTEETAAAAALAALPFQIFECESCGMEMRPAKGRADIILGRERFRCSRCGAKAAAYFNIDDMEDPRAVARLERLKEIEDRDEADIDDEDPNDTTDDDDDDDDE